MYTSMEPERILTLDEREMLLEALKQLVLERKPIYECYLNFLKKESETERASKGDLTITSKEEG